MNIYVIGDRTLIVSFRGNLQFDKFFLEHLHYYSRFVFECRESITNRGVYSYFPVKSNLIVPASFNTLGEVFSFLRSFETTESETYAISTVEGIIEAIRSLGRTYAAERISRLVEDLNRLDPQIPSPDLNR